MARRKAKKQPAHAYVRLGERVGMTRKQVKDFSKQASRYGRAPEHFPPSALRDYLLSKSYNKRVKVYKGIVVIMANTSNRIITAYPLPNELMEEYNEYGKQ